MEPSFWFLIFLIVYCYFGYPLILGLLARWGRPVRKGDDLPPVSLVISVHNEEDVIHAKLKNLLSLDYPRDKLEILIGSDGSSDQTDTIIASLRDPRVKLFANPQRRGKMTTINELVQRAGNGIIVFADARQLFDDDAVKKLVANFADETVGCVSGELMLSKKENPTSQGINLYWNYEKWLRSRESRIHSMLGATGAIYAIRKELFTPVPSNIVLDDMYVPLKIVEKGYRAIFDETAKAYDEVAESSREEHTRKARTLFGNYQIFGVFLNLFNPFRSPVAIQLFSHKFLRVVVPFLMIAVFLLNLGLLHKDLYRPVFVLQLLFYAMAVLGCLSRHEKYGIFRAVSKVCYVPYVFCLLNFSALAGFFKFAGARQDIAWQKARKQK